MRNKAKLAIEQSKIREQISALLGKDELTDDDRTKLGELTTRMEQLEVEMRAAIVAEPGETIETRDEQGDGETRELRQLRGRVRMGNYIAAAMEMRSADGAELEWNQHLGIAGNRFPLELLAPAMERRATTDTESNVSQRTWLDRLFAGTAASRLGVSMISVEPGVSSHPLTTAGASFAQKERGAAVGDAAWTVGVTEAKPKRGAVRATFSIEDTARLPGLEDALNRDLRMALTDGIDKAIFVGADGGSANTADIAGLTTASITETTLTQANKVKWPETVQAFAAMLDGVHAATLEDLNIVASVGAARLWVGTQANANRNESVAQIMRGNGLSWGSREGIDTDTANGDFGAFIGRGRGIEGAGCACLWAAGELIRDPYSGAAKGEVALTLSYMWDFVIPRTASFQRLKFVT